MKLADWIRKKKQKQAHWVGFNFLGEYEFAECSLCGAEAEPDLSYFPHALYPLTCPKCGAIMTCVDYVT